MMSKGSRALWKAGFLALMLLTAYGTTVYGQKTVENTSVVEDVTAAHFLAAEALQNGDAAGVMEYFSPQFSTAGGSYTMTREGILQGLASGDLQFISIQSQIERVDVSSGNAAIVTGQRSVTARVNGQMVNYQYGLTAAYVREAGGGWQALLWAPSNPCL